MKNIIMGLIMTAALLFLLIRFEMGIQFKNEYLVYWLNPIFLARWRGRQEGISKCFHNKLEWDLIGEKRKPLGHQEIILSLIGSFDCAIEDFKKAESLRGSNSETKWRIKYVLRLLLKTKSALEVVPKEDTWRGREAREAASEVAEQAIIAMFAYEGWLPTCMAISVRDMADNMFWEAYWLGRE